MFSIKIFNIFVSFDRMFLLDFEGIKTKKGWDFNLSLFYMF